MCRCYLVHGRYRLWTHGSANIIAIVLLAPKASAILKDYEQQKREGKNWSLIPKSSGIKDETGALNVSKWLYLEQIPVRHSCLGSYIGHTENK